MKSVVLIKRTPDTETKIKIGPDGKSVDHKDTKFIINPYDEFAIEEALKVQEAKGGEVVVVSFGPQDTKELIIKALAMGADRGVLVDQAGFEAADSLVVAEVLAKVIAKESPQLVFCGKQAIDDDNMHVAVMVGELLNWPHVNVVGKLTFDGDKVIAEREVEGGQVEVHETTMPAIVGANKGLNNPRFASLPGIMKAKKKPLQIMTVAELGLSASDTTSKTQVVEYTYPPQKPAGKLFKNEPLEVMVNKVADLLRSEAKVL